VHSKLYRYMPSAKLGAAGRCHIKSIIFSTSSNTVKFDTFAII
jgi:hypothetical protein